jgi:hypothetical protein
MPELKLFSQAKEPTFRWLSTLPIPRITIARRATQSEGPERQRRTVIKSLLFETNDDEFPTVDDKDHVIVTHSESP